MHYFDTILFGGDYNPEQWDQETWEEDMQLLVKAHINTVTINVFAWAQLQPSENCYDFTQLDDIIQLAKKYHLHIILGTSTAALPAWMSHKYPDVNRVDYQGRKHHFGNRHNACPNSPTFKKYSARLAGKLAERYHNDVTCYHVSNEYGGKCYCENCVKAFHRWLKEKYQSIEVLNKAWNTAFWGHTFYSFEEIPAPNYLGDGIGASKTALPALSLDYDRFNSDSILQNFLDEKEAIRTYDFDTPITTNLMGAYKDLNYESFAREMDVIAWDCYPSIDTKVTYTSFVHDLMRGLRQGQSFMLMEQSPSQQNWQPYNSLKAPGVMRLQSYQALAHGADTVLYFQLKQSRGGCEKFHSAVIPHCGAKHSRVYHEVKDLGEELTHLTPLLHTRTRSDVAILFNWDSYWGIGYTSGPSQDLDYVYEVYRYYEGLSQYHWDLDVITMESDFSKYQYIFAPCLYMITHAQAQKIREFVCTGGTFITTTMSGITDLNDNVELGGYPALLQDVFGMFVEETDARKPDSPISITLLGEKTKAHMLCDLIHCTDAQVLGSYQEAFYAGMPVVTENHFGNGHAYYVGTMLDEEGLDLLFRKIFPLLKKHDPLVEIKHRYNKRETYTFLLNYHDHDILLAHDYAGYNMLTQQYENVHKLKAYDVKILKKANYIKIK